VVRALSRTTPQSISLQKQCYRRRRRCRCRCRCRCRTNRCHTNGKFAVCYAPRVVGQPAIWLELVTIWRELTTIWRELVTIWRELTTPSRHGTPERPEQHVAIPFARATISSGPAQEAAQQAEARRSSTRCPHCTGR